MSQGVPLIRNLEITVVLVFMRGVLQAVSGVGRGHLTVGRGVAWIVGG